MSSIEGSVVITDRKEMESAQGYISLVFGHLARLDAVLGNPEVGAISQNVYAMGMLLISHIPEEEKREELRKKFDKIVAEKVKDLQNESGAKVVDESMRRFARIYATTIITGDIISYFNKSIGLTKDAKLAFDKSCSTCDYKVYWIKLKDENKDVFDYIKSLHPDWNLGEL